jgi:hypothetical protein
VTAVKNWSLWCDHPACATADAYNLGRDYSTLAPLRDHATRLDGWTHVDGKDFCPAHSTPQRPVERLPRGACPSCRQVRRLRLDGTMGGHNRLTTRGYAIGYCDGVGKPSVPGT